MTPEVGPRPPRRRLVGRDRLAADLRSLGLQQGQDLLIHCSLRQVGRIDGGAATLLNAIVDVAGPEATLVVPAQTTLNSLTSRAFVSATAGLEAEERARFIAAMPGFDPASTPSADMGAFAEYVRTRPSASRSHHPQASFAAIGPSAHTCTSVHDLECHLGDRSPLGWLYAANAAILLLGVRYSACTAFHLAEYHLPGAPPGRLYRCFTGQGETRAEHEFTGLDLDDSDFELLGAELESAAEHDTSFGMRRGQVGSAECRLVPLRPAVDFARSWLEVRRGRVISHDKTASALSIVAPHLYHYTSAGRAEVERAVPDDSDYGSPFFLSYARAREGSARARDADEHVEKFFHDLEENVSELISLPAAVPAGFMDREMRGGMWWTDELIRAVGTCRVLIALLSARYLSSKWCRMEWHAFSQRTVRARAGKKSSTNQSCIIPVIWAPLPCALPEHVSPTLVFSPTGDPNRRVPRHYRENGVYGLMRTGEPKNSYEIVAWRLAQNIASIYHSQLTERRTFELAELRSCLPGDDDDC